MSRASTTLFEGLSIVGIREFCFCRRLWFVTNDCLQFAILHEISGSSLKLLNCKLSVYHKSLLFQHPPHTHAHAELSTILITVCKEEAVNPVTQGLISSANNDPTPGTRLRVKIGLLPPCRDQFLISGVTAATAERTVCSSQFSNIGNESHQGLSGCIKSRSLRLAPPSRCLVLSLCRSQDLVFIPDSCYLSGRHKPVSRVSIVVKITLHPRFYFL